MRSAIEVGDLVWNGHGGWLRFGTVVHKRIGEDRWAYYKIEWHNDERYQSAQDSYYSINPNGNYGLTEFRAGQVYPISSERLDQILESHRGPVKENETPTE